MFASYFLMKVQLLHLNLKNPFKKKNKSNVQKLKDKNSKIQESTEEAAPAIYTQSEEEYIDDTDAIHIRDIEIYGNNLIETSFIKSQLSSKEGYPFNRKKCCK